MEIIILAIDKTPIEVLHTTIITEILMDVFSYRWNHSGGFIYANVFVCARDKFLIETFLTEDINQWRSIDQASIKVLFPYARSHISSVLSNV